MGCEARTYCSELQDANRIRDIDPWASLPVQPLPSYSPKEAGVLFLPQIIHGEVLNIGDGTTLWRFTGKCPFPTHPYSIYNVLRYIVYTL